MSDMSSHGHLKVSTTEWYAPGVIQVGFTGNPDLSCACWSAQDANFPTILLLTFAQLTASRREAHIQAECQLPCSGVFSTSRLKSIPSAPVYCYVVPHVLRHRHRQPASDCLKWCRWIQRRLMYASQARTKHGIAMPGTMSTTSASLIPLIWPFSAACDLSACLGIALAKMCKLLAFCKPLWQDG